MVYEAADDRMADMARRLDPLGKIHFGKKSLHRKNSFRFGKKKYFMVYGLMIMMTIIIEG